MAHFQIYLPGVTTPDAKHLADVGLSDLADNAAMVGIKGPDNQMGMLVSWSKCFDREKNWTWKKAKPFNGLKAGRYWYGLNQESMPTPNELQRNYRKKGIPLTLDDDHQWLIPISQELPSNFQIADDGSFKFVVHRNFHDFHLESEEWTKKLLKDGISALEPLEDATRHVLKALCINYRLTIEVISDMHLLTKENVQESLLLICGLSYGS